MTRRKFLIGFFSGLPFLSGKFRHIQVQNKFDSHSTPSTTKRNRARELGIKIGELNPGSFNAITDVEGVLVGQETIIQGEGKGAIRTGVTVIIPRREIYENNLFSAYFNLNGWGEMTGIAPIEHCGRLKTPIFLTGTYNVGIVYDAALAYAKEKFPDMAESGNIPAPVVAECFDDFLSDTQKRGIEKRHVFKAIESASSGPVTEGAVGGGTGMVSFGFKGGIGTSSRTISIKDTSYTAGVLVMANTASRRQLRIDGVPVGKEISGFTIEPGKTKSIILVAATDAPLLPFQLRKIAKRVAIGLANTGAISHTGSGDIIFAFSTGNVIPGKTSEPFLKVDSVSDFWITPLYQGIVEATQEAIINALTAAATTTGRDGNTVYGLPLEKVKNIMKKYLRIGGKIH
jgi:D-aminopeptidase